MSRGRGRGGGNNNQQNNRNNNGQQQGGGRKKKRSRGKRQDPAIYWGDPAKLPNPESFETASPDTAAIVKSLGRAPIPGTASEHYFTLMYDRAAQMATILSVAGGLDDLTPIEPEPVDDELEDANVEGNDTRDAVESDEPDDELREVDAADELDAAEAASEEE